MSASDRATGRTGTATELPPSQRLVEQLARDRTKLRREITLTALTGVGLLVGLLAGWGREAQPALAWAGYALAYLAGGLPAAGEALRAMFRRRRLSISFLMVLAAVAAALVGEVRDGAILLFLYSLAETLEGYAMGNTKRAVAALMELKPETATVLEGAQTRVMPVESVRIGQRIAVRPGERIPLDGILLSGAGAVDQSPITGESVPVDKAPGDELFAGSVNGYSSLTIEVSKDASSSTLARMIHLVTVAQAQRSPSQRFSDWFGERYTFVVLIGAALALGAFFLLGLPSREAFYKAATLLVVMSPCAIVISVPAAVLSSLARAARFGVLFKGGAAIEEFGAIETVAVDKTGTLTEAKMKVVEVRPFGLTEPALLELASAIERGSEHPVAQAIVAAAESAGERASEDRAGREGLLELEGSLEPSSQRPSVELVAVPGKGVTATLPEGEFWAGNRKLATALGIELSPEVTAEIDRLEAGGRTTVLVGRAAGPLAASEAGGEAGRRDVGAVLGVIAVADTVRASASEALQSLRAGGVDRIVMLTGDNAVVAKAVAAELGIAQEHVHAGLLPEDKVTIVERYRQEGPLAFVGDGVNDAAALATATVGVAMGAAGTDVAIEAADVALLSNDLTRLPAAHALARRTNVVIRQNLTFALGIMLVMVAFTLFGDLPLPLGVLGHEGGTILVVLNGLRLLAWQPGSAQARRARPVLSPRVSGRRA